MNNAPTKQTLTCLMLFLALGAPLSHAQERSPVDLTGTWRWLHQEDAYEIGQGPGADPGQYAGLPLNDAARMRADTYSEEWVSTSPLLQCRPRSVTYQPLGLDPMRIEQFVDPLNRQLLAYRVSYEKTPGERMIWLDDRPRPSPYAKHSWEGFSNGKFKGDTLEINVSHIKESYVRRNGVPTSFRTTVFEQVALDEPFLTWVITVMDPDYLTEPLVKSATYIRAPTLQLPQYPCQVLDDRPPGAEYRVPHYLLGQNPYLTEDVMKYRMPIETLRGGAEKNYPEWRAIARKLSPPVADAKLTAVYNDASTHIAERAEAQPKRAPTYDKTEWLHAAGNVYMVGGAGGNIAVSAGGDGIILVDSGVAEASPKVLEAIQHIAEVARAADRSMERSDSASPFGDTWQATHSFRNPIIRMIINTNDDLDHVGGNANIRKSPLFRGFGSEGGGAALPIVAHNQVQQRMTDRKDPELAIPTSVYSSETFTLHRFLNAQAIQIFHMPNAITDGDSVVLFRRSDVIAAGDIYSSEIYPPIDLARGGSIAGEIEALNKLVDMCVTEFMSQGGTLVIPGHGWLSDAGDVSLYRDMLIIIRDRVQDMIDKGMTLEQVRAAKPTVDYDPEFGRQPGATARFVEAVYRSLKDKKAK
jgi:glyoxylase-like metal-dependent hydrolase (beta-lactamase superfamily II)